jgi:hypothetical protein
MAEEEFSKHVQPGRHEAVEPEDKLLEPREEECA